MNLTNHLTVSWCGAEAALESLAVFISYEGSKSIDFFTHNRQFSGRDCQLRTDGFLIK